MRKLWLFCFLTVLLTVGRADSETTVDWWQFWTDPGIKPTIEAMVDEFEQQNPDITVKLTDMTWANGHEKIALAFASGSAPDVVELGSDWIAQFADNGQLADISDHIAADSNQFDGWSLARYKGKIYGRPWILGTRVLFINNDLAWKAGLGESFVPVKWDELKKGAEAVNNLAPNIYGWGSNTAEKHRLYKKFMPFLWSNQGQVLSDGGEYCVISSSRAIEALEFYKELHDCCGYVADQRGIEDAFLDGQIGFIISGDWLLKRIRQENRKISIATSLIPGHNPFGNQEIFSGPFANTETYPGKSFLGGEFLAVSAQSEERDAALKLIDFITSPENQVRFCKANYSANPSSHVAQQDSFFQDDPNLQTFINQMKLAEHPPVDPDWVYMEAEIEKAVEEVVFEGDTPANALYQAQKNIAKLRSK
jgi:ABC-type glycerol-3-phosphate transport system substrate-binding protein